MAPTLRSCLRCIAKKRKCDHAFPCSLCVKAEADCDYPPDQQRRGPIAGYTKILEKRMQDLMAALAYVVSIDGVQQVLKTTIYTGPTEIAPNDAWASLSREDRIELILSRPLRTVHDLLAYTEVLPSDAPSSLRPRHQPERQGRHEAALSSSQRRSRETVEPRDEVAGQTTLARRSGDDSRRRQRRSTIPADDFTGSTGLRQLGCPGPGPAGRPSDDPLSVRALGNDATEERAEPEGFGETDSEHQGVLPAMQDASISAILKEHPAWFIHDRSVGPGSVAPTVPSVGTPLLPRPTANDIFW